MEILEKIKEVQMYFKSEILAGNFELDCCTKHVMTIIVDRLFKFSIWVGNLNIPSTVKLYLDNGYPNFIEIIFEEEECIELHNIVIPIYNKWNEEVYKKQKLEMFNELKNELGL